jgi:predicted amino acid-binding ACT domain protein
LDEASAAFGSDKFVVCIEKLDELEQRDDTFQADYRISTRDEAIKGLVEQTNSLLDQGKLDESISKTQALAALAPDLPELEDLEQRVEVEQEFFGYYSEAIACLGNNDFEEAAKQCEKLKNSLRGAEHQDYIKDKLEQMLPHVTKGLYDQAANCLDEPDCQPENAKKLLALIKRLDPEFVDEQQLEAAIRDREKSERNRNIIILAILIVAAIVTGLALLNAFNTNERLNDILQTTYEESTRHFEEREAKINGLEVEITRISKDKEATISAGQAEIDSLEEQVDGAIKVGENLATATSALATADANLYNIEKTVAAATIEIGSLRADLDEKETTVSTLEANLASTRAIVPVSLVLQNIEWSSKPISNPEPEDALFNYEVIEAIGKNEDSSFYKVRVKRDNEWVEGWISSVMFDAYVSFDENKLPIITETPEVTGE